MNQPFTLITGATSEIGRALSVRLAREHSLILHGRSEVQLSSLRDPCSQSHECCIWPYDLTGIDGIPASLGAILTSHDICIESFVHCAGTLELGAFRLTKPESERRIFEVNLFSAIEIARFLSRKQPNQARLSNVLFISTAASLFGDKGNTTYAASKAGLDAFMKSLAIELAPGGRANSILPGMIEGGMAGRILETSNNTEALQANYPLGLGRPDDIVNAAEFLLSKEARWITGQQILVDGGYSAHCGHQ